MPIDAAGKNVNISEWEYVKSNFRMYEHDLTDVNATHTYGSPRTITVSGQDYKYFEWTGSGDFTPGSSGYIEVLVVGGGGGGGQLIGGGGGAGGLIWINGYYVYSGNAYDITIGAGSGNNTDGTNSTMGELIAYGGGAGGRYNDGVHANNTGRTGGSGGGAGYYGSGGSARQTQDKYSNTTATTNASAPSYSQEYGWGSSGGHQADYETGGGGGAGYPGTTNAGGHRHKCRGGRGLAIKSFEFWGTDEENGGDGTYTSSGGRGWFAAGGGGGCNDSTTEFDWRSDSYGGEGGVGGGGRGSGDIHAGTDAIDGTGSGGGGGQNWGGSYTNGKDGGNGIVLIRYPV